MAEVVYVLGAGFSRSVVQRDRPGNPIPPVVNDFFRVFLTNPRYGPDVDRLDPQLYLHDLFDAIERYWKLTRQDLLHVDFNIEECLTFFESQLDDERDDARRTRLLHITYAVRTALLMHLADLSRFPTAAAEAFGTHVLAERADVVTFNYDTLAEDAIERMSGPADVLAVPPRGVYREFDAEIPDEDLDASTHNWRRTLAHGFRFDEVSLPVPGVSRWIAGSRYYADPRNALYQDCRVLKLHGSIDWLRYTKERDRPDPPGSNPAPRSGLVLQNSESYWFGRRPTHDGWYMDPVVIPPQLHKNYRDKPFPRVWKEALTTLSSCSHLIVIGYSFSPSDYRAHRLIREAFSDHQLSRLTVIDPSDSAAAPVQYLTHFDGYVERHPNADAYYRVPSVRENHIDTYA